jgi:hypothetical protein
MPSSSTPKRVTFHSLEPLPDDPEEVKEEVVEQEGKQPSHWVVVPIGSSPREVDRWIELDTQNRLLTREIASLQIRYNNLDKALSNPVLFSPRPTITPWQSVRPRLTSFAIGCIVSGCAALSIWLIVTYHWANLLTSVSIIIIIIHHGYQYGDHP